MLVWLKVGEAARAATGSVATWHGTENAETWRAAAVLL